MKQIWHFFITFMGMCIIGFFGLLGIHACSEIFTYLFTHCFNLMCYTITFVFGVIGVTLGWFMFCDGLDKLKTNKK